MDNLDLCKEDLYQVLDELSSINKYFGNTRSILKEVKKEILQESKPLKIVDLGCGGGDTLREIAIFCLKNNKEVELIGIDANNNILEYAKRKNNHQIKINYKKEDILKASFDLEPCDILISSHFIYHFKEGNLINFLNKIKFIVNKKIIFGDLYRSPFSFYLFKFLGFLLPFHPIVKQDGLKAIRRSFTINEMRTLIELSNFKKYSIKLVWAFRYTLIITMR